jgi:DNA primase
MAFPPGFLDELRSRVSLGDLVGRRVRLTRRGREQGGLCPFHNEKTPSFYVVEDKGFFHCFGCGAHGDAIGFVMRADNLDFIEAVERLAGEAGIAVPQQTAQERERAQRQKTLMEALAAAASFYEAQLWAAGNSTGGARARDYLTARGLDDETIRRFRLGWAPEDRQSLRRALAGDFPEALLVEAGLLRVPEGGGNAYDYFRGRVMFPIGDRAGRVIGFGARTIPGSSPGTSDQPKYLNSPDTPLFQKGRVLYGWSAARANIGGDRDPGGHGVIVTEGYMDVITLHRAGFGTAVAPLGTALTEAQLRELWRLAPEPVLCFDGDSAGQRAALRALERALPLLQPGRSLRFVKLPAGDDPDSLIRGPGRADFAARLAAAQPLSEMLWQAELAARPIDTPERRADLKARLERHVREIADSDVQREYRRALFDRYFALTRPPAAAHSSARRLARGFDRWGNRAESVSYTVPPLPGSIREHVAPQTPPRQPWPRPAARLHREIFLGLLVCCPALIEEWFEQIAELDLPEPELDRLRCAILEVGHSHLGLDAEQFRQHLASCGHADTVSLLTKTITAHAGFAAGAGDDPEVIRLGLEETLQLLRANGSDDNAGSVANPSDEDLQRVVALKEREAQDGPIGGTGSEPGRFEEMLRRGGSNRDD